MADKETQLSIVIRTVDRATAGIQAINKKLDAATKPTRDFSKALGELKEKSGFNAVSEGFHGVAEGAKEALWKVVEVGAVVGEVTHLVLEMAEGFAKLGHTAEKDGVTVDFLASMRYAAQKAGVSVEELDEGFTTFGQNVGLARGNTGRMFKFLESKAPALLTQLKATKDNGKAFLLLADAMAAVSDPAKRLALAQKTVGNNALAVVLAKGSKELIKQQAEYLSLAGSQEKAAGAGMEIEEGMVTLKAATDGVKAALVTGLAPALKVIIDRMKEWVVEHRADIERWAEDVGKKIPGAVDKVVDAIKSVVSKIEWLVDTFGGANIAIGAVAAVIIGPLVSSLAALGVAMVANPFGLIVVGAAAAVAAVAELVLVIKTLQQTGGPRTSKSYDLEQKAMDAGALPGGHERAPTDLERKMMEVGALPKSRRFRIDEGRRAALDREASANLEAIRSADDERERLRPPDLTTPDWLRDPSMLVRDHPAGPAPDQRADIKVTFENAPKGLRATVGPQNTANVDLTVGHQFGFGGM